MAEGRLWRDCAVAVHLRGIANDNAEHQSLFVAPRVLLQMLSGAAQHSLWPHERHFLQPSS